MAAFQSKAARQTSMASTPDVMEIGLLLPTSRVNALIELSKKKRQSVGQILRGLIDRALEDGDKADGLEDPFRATGADELGTFV